MADRTNDISLIIKTFERQEALERLLASIREQGYGHCPILIADDSKTPYKDAILQDYGDIVDQYIVLPFDSGLSRGRNKLLDCVETEHFVLNDDDFVYSEETNLKGAKAELLNNNLDILGGYLYWSARRYWFSTLPRRISDALRLYEAYWDKRVWLANIQQTEDGGVSIQTQGQDDQSLQRCDLCSNFFIGRTCLIRDRVGGWNSKLKAGSEHWEFFYRCKQKGLAVACSDTLLAYHVQESNPFYDRFRHDRQDEMMIKSIQEHDLKYLKRGSTVFKNPSYFARQTSTPTES